MSGESRLAYHAVPCVLPGTLPACLDPGDDTEAQEGEEGAKAQAEEDGMPWAQVREYLLDGRINVNVRQVLAQGQQWPHIP